MFGFEFVEGGLCALRFILMLVCGFTCCIEQLCESFVLGFESLRGALGVRELCAELLEGDFEVPVLFLEFV